ncbi:hypothetical protein AAMO2058_000420100 [Amorphochlora amoebiformis]
MARSSYGRDEFEGFRIFILVGSIVAAAFFTFMHTVNRVFFIEKKNLTGNSKLLSNAIVGANWTFVFTSLPHFIAHTIISPDNSPTICRNMHLWALFAYMVANFSFYRVLLYKSQVYDAMREYKKTYFYVFWAVHIMCPSLTLVAETIYALGKYKILTENISGGSRLCILYGYHYLEFLGEGPIPPFLAAFSDLAISLGCLLLLVLPLTKPGFTPVANSGVVRNVVYSSIAIFSTFTILLAMATMELKENWIAGYVMEIGALDLMLNVVCINLCWPLRFYARIARRIYLSVMGLKDESVSTSAKRKNTNSSGIKCKDVHLHPRISTRDSGDKSGPMKPIENVSIQDSKIIGIKSFNISANKDICTPKSGCMSQHEARIFISRTSTRSPRAFDSVSKK